MTNKIKIFYVKSLRYLLLYSLVFRKIGFSSKFLRSITPNFFVKAKLYGGVNLYVNPAEELGYDYFYSGGYEKRISELIRSYLKEGGTAVDIGTCYGYYSILMSLITGESGSVYGFEIDSTNYDITSKNITLNGSKNIRLNKVAVSDKKGTLFFESHSTDKNLPANYGLGHLTQSQSTSAGSVPTTSLDIYFQEQGIKKLNFIKIDVEGHEVHVIKGMDFILTNYRPFMIIEFSASNLARDNETMSSLYEKIKSYNYELYMADSIYLKKIDAETLSRYDYLNAWCVPCEKE